MKKIITLIMSILIISILTGCGITGKGSRSWLENEVSDIEKVYPTENPEDLFEKFPNGFTIYQARIVEENGKTYSVRLEMKGSKDIKKIEGEVKKVLLESKPYKETIEKESKVEYKKGKGLVLEKPELTGELLPKNYFLFQKLKLNKDIFKQLEVEKNLYTPETGTYTILYKIANDVINNYFNLNDEQITLGVSGEYNEEDKSYFHNITIRKKTKIFTFYERIVEEK